MSPVTTPYCADSLKPAAVAAAFPRSTVSVTRYCDGEETLDLAGVICEQELRIVANGVQLVNLLCSGVALRELAHGFLYSEGVVRSLADVRGCWVDEDAMVVEFDLAVPVRRPGCPTVSSGFGGKVLRSPLLSGRADRRGAADADELRGRRAGAPGERDGLVTDDGLSCDVCREGSARPSIDEVFFAMAAMDAAAVEYHATRGMHCSALFCDGKMLGCFEDIGRHNTFDKLAGHCLLTGASAQGTLLTTTGRVSAEMCTKALRLGVAAIASCSGPTDQSVSLAREAGVMLVGYAGKPGRAPVYASGGVRGEGGLLPFEAAPLDRIATFSTDWPSGPAPLDETAAFSTGFAGGSRAAAEKSQVDGLSFRDLGRGAPESVEKMAILSTGRPRDPRSVEKTAILSTGFLRPVRLA